MSTPEDEIKDLREKNNELVQKVQYWKMTAAQRENEKLELMKEINELRLKISRMRSGGAAHARKLDAALQTASEEALSHLVQASGAVARTIELAKTYMRDRQELENETPRWTNISGHSNTERVHRVPPMMMGGQSIQPVVSLSRAIFNTSNQRSTSRSPHQNRSITGRAVPMHMLQDVYIPLTRIDANDLPGNNVETEDTSNVDDSTDDLELEDSNERTLEESPDVTEDNFEVSGRLDAVAEDLETEDDAVIVTPPPRSRTENPLEGPSWLLDVPTYPKVPRPRARGAPEPDSTTREPSPAPAPAPAANTQVNSATEGACEFSPTVRRRKRTSSPPQTYSPLQHSPLQHSPLQHSPLQHSPKNRSSQHYSPRLTQRRHSTSGRVLKVVVAKMRLEGSSEAGAGAGGGGGGEGGAGDGGGEGGAGLKRVSRGTPPPGRSKHMRFDAPSPNGTTDAGVIVSEEKEDAKEQSAVEVEVGVKTERSVAGGGGEGGGEGGSVGEGGAEEGGSRSSSAASRDSQDAEYAAPRSRRQRKPVTYKEKPLNRKMRR